VRIIIKPHSKQPVADPRLKLGTSQIPKQGDSHCAMTLGVLITRSGTERHTIVRVRTLKAVKRMEWKGARGGGKRRKKMRSVRKKKKG
jgi:hypothetical protein